MSPVLHFLIPLLYLSTASGETQVGSCIPECRATNGDLIQIGMVMDPKSCSRYYDCYNGEITTAFPLNCPEGYFFDTAIAACVFSSACANNPGCDPTCRYESSGGFENLADRADCTKYYVTNGLSSVHTDCAGGQYFNGVTCQLDPDECCDPCLFYCGKAQTNIADPFDCTNYYFCQSADYFPDALDSHTCPSGQFYDQVLKTCTDSSDCSQLC